jgi:regulator of replication initiation timing
MTETSLDELRKELARLETEESRLSAERHRVQDRIDLGFATDHTRARERELSDGRRQLHQRIDELRELLRAQERQTV